MKTLFKILFIFFILTLAKGNAQTLHEVEAYTDDNCKSVIAEFKIPKGFLAFHFDFKVIPKWEPCNITGDEDFNMVGIRAKNNKYSYMYFIYKNGDIKESSDLSAFILGPGVYELVISSNKGNWVELKYSTGKEIALISD